MQSFLRRDLSYTEANAHLKAISVRIPTQDSAVMGLVLGKCDIIINLLCKLLRAIFFYLSFFNGQPLLVAPWLLFHGAYWLLYKNGCLFSA